jgi:hypothetical protein
VNPAVAPNPFPVCLGIDPGPDISAIVAYDGQRIIYAKQLPNEEMLKHLMVERYNVDHLAIEMIASYGMAVGESTFMTCVWIGRFMQQFGANQTRLIKRLEVKLHLCKDSRAKDGNIRQALVDRFGEPGSKKHPGLTYGISGHAWQALALVVTYFDLYAATGAVA